jgi:thiol-disulfide isomerase/thioredoxin
VARALVAAFAFLPLVSGVSPGQARTIGEAAPPINLDNLVPAGTQATWESLRGRPVVVEFWATWCGPCLHEIPHLNQLASKFKAVQFISITDEPFSVVESFLKTNPISGWVALDRDRSAFKAYGIDFVPQTALVDEARVLRGIIHPRQLTVAVLTDLVAGRTLSPLRLSRPSRIFQEPGKEPLFAVLVRPAALGKVGGLLHRDPGIVEGENLDLKHIIAHAYSTDSTRVEGPVDILATRYDFAVLLPRQTEGESQMLRDTLERTFKLRVRRDRREVDALVLRAGTTKLQPSPRDGHTMAELARTLEWRLKRFVVDETGMSGRYNFKYPDGEGAIDRFVRDQLGLDLVPAKKSIDILVVESVQVPSFR